MRREAEKLCSDITLRKGIGGVKCAYEERQTLEGPLEGVDLVAGCRRWATDAAHILAKSSWPSVRFDLRNLTPLCRCHHELLGEARLVGPSPMRDAYVETHGRHAWEALITWASRPGPPLADVVEGLRNIARGMGIR